MPYENEDALGLRGVDHVGVAVPNLDDAIDYYTAVLGMRCVHREENEEQGVQEAMLEVGGPGGTRVQLLAPLNDQSPIARFLDRRGPGLQQVAYEVADIETASRVLRARGAQLLYDAPRAGTAGSLVNFVHPRSAGGVLVELVQPVRHGDAESPTVPPIPAGAPIPTTGPAEHHRYAAT
jgi:methylmalonyl-CoA/ethylmalonyl-CoA epimerase